MQHVHPANIKLTYKLKTNHIYLVTDAWSPLGTDLTTFSIYGKQLFVKEDRCLDSSGKLGGSNITLIKAIKNLIDHCEVSLEESLAMATIIPAKFMKIDKDIGKIEKGYRADIISMNLDDFTCKTIHLSMQTQC